MNTDRTQSRQHARDVRDGIMFNRYAAPRRRMEQGCDASAVPRCAQIALRYDKGCEKLQAHQATK
jgi:hypothetical protein